MTTRKSLITLFSVGSLTLLIALALTFGAGYTTSYAAKEPGFMGKPMFYHFHSSISHSAVAPAIRTAASSLPSWTSSFSYGGTTYSYTMVGTNPANGSATTTVPTVIVPLKLTFSNGRSFDGTQKVSNTTASPLFHNATYSSGTTQYGDAIQRAEFWKKVSTVSPNYHVLLGTPGVASTISISVPSTKGKTQTDSSTGKIIGLVEVNWLDSYIQSHLLPSYGANVFPIFLSYNVYAYDTVATNCCIGGYHSAASTTAGNKTYTWSTNTDAGVQGGFGNDVGALSHEVSEWYNDPFVNNTVPSWSVPSQPQYGCSSSLETGDPLVGVNFSVSGFSGYHLQDEAFFSWFARQSPSIGINGRYTYLGKFSTYSPAC